MVVDLATITEDCLDLFIEKLQKESKSNEYLNKLKEEDNYEEIKNALIPNDFNMIVTPKEIDDLIENMSSVVARGINKALIEKITNLKSKLIISEKGRRNIRSI